MSHHLVLDLVERVGGLARGATVDVALTGDNHELQASTVAAWCERTGNQLIAITADRATIRQGQLPDPLAELPADLQPGTRLWMYTNFDCNLACTYCCVRSSPQTSRRPLGVDRVRQLAAEAAAAGVSELVLTGGEPFLLPDIDELVAACTEVLPTTLLTNGMLWKGRRLEALRRMNRNNLALQISLDSATATLHDANRGRGSWDRAIAGIHTAHAEGFRVRVAATLPAEHAQELGAFHDFLDSLNIAREDQVIRALAHRGIADKGVELTIESLIPEVTVTAEGVYWHPISADDADQLVTREIFPLAAAITEVRRRFAEYRARASAAAQWFPCA